MRHSLASVALLSLVACGGGAPVPQGGAKGGNASGPGAPASVSSATRFKLTLEGRGAWGFVSDASGTCLGATGGSDKLDGDVTLSGIDETGAKYVGRLKRATKVQLCETNETADGTKWCVGDLDGSGTFRVTITVPPRGRDNENASVVLEPDAGVKANVAGGCDSLDKGAVKADYEDGDTLYFETANHAAARVMPTGGLVPGSWSQSRHDPDTGYKLVVAAVP